MSENLRRKLEILTNIAIILLVLVTGYIVISNRTSKSSQISARSIESGEVKLELGQKMPLPDIDWSKYEHTLLMVMSEGCKFCTQSAEFYKKIVQESDKEKNNLIAVFPQDAAVGKTYLEKMQVEIKNIIHSPLTELGVRGTPTLILVDKNGSIKNKWVGRLPAEKEIEVMQLLK